MNGIYDMDDVDTTELDQPKGNLAEDGTPIIPVDDMEPIGKLCNVTIEFLKLLFGNICIFPLYTSIMQI